MLTTNYPTTRTRLAHLASRSEKAPVEFKMKEVRDKRAVFANLARCFPQRVLYWIEPDAAVKARIEGTLQGSARHEIATRALSVNSNLRFRCVLAVKTRER